MPEKGNMLLLTKEAIDRDRSLKTPLLLARDLQKAEKVSGDPIWKKFDYFGDERADFSIEKKSFPENVILLC